MERASKSAAKTTGTGIISSLKSLRLNPASTTKRSSPSSQPSDLNRSKPRRLLSLCLGVLGQYFEDIHEDLIEIAAVFPPDIKLMMVAIARRKKLLTDDLLIALADGSWKVLDLSGSDVSDSGLAKAAQVCTNVKAIDISRCENITTLGVSELLNHCRSLEILRCGGCPRSDRTARRCLSILKPELKNLEEESWEELDSMDIGITAASLRWLVWPKIDETSRINFATECPRIVVNPRPSLIGIHGKEIPVEALANVTLDESLVEDIDPKTWAFAAAAIRRPVSDGAAIRRPVSDGANEMHIAEKFRLAFVERDTRLAPKRAKNERQHRRREARDWLMSSSSARSVVLAYEAKKFLHL